MNTTRPVRPTHYQRQALGNIYNNVVDARVGSAATIRAIIANGWAVRGWNHLELTEAGCAVLRMPYFRPSPLLLH